MTRTPRMKLLSLLAVLGLVAAACGSDSGTDTSGTTSGSSDTTAVTDTTDGSSSDTTGMTGDTSGESSAGVIAEGGLADVCPATVVIQTDWFPEAEHGALYEMVGDDYTVDTNAKVVSGTLMAGANTIDTGVQVEVRTGGPAIGYAPVSSAVYTDDSITLAYQNTEAQILAFDETPMISVIAPLEKNPQMIMWDPATYPDVKTLADLGTEGVTINVFIGGVFADVFAADGTWNADQVDPSYDGSPSRFISEGGAIAQQGFASAEPYNYEKVFTDWGKPVAYQLLHDAGFEVYSQTIAVRPDQLEELTPCLEKIVPVIQQAIIDYANSPDRANAIIIDAVEKYADFWVYDQGVADYSDKTMLDLELVGNGPDSTVGNMDEARIQGVIDQIRDAGMDVNADLTPADIYTNQFIDESIGF